MKRILAASIILGTTLPALVASVWLFGCCVLPFHQSMHSAMPLCHMAASAPDGASSRQQPSTAPRENERSVVIRAALAPAAQVAAPRVREASLEVASRAAYRSFISLGAMRCDRDVGLHTFLATFII